MYCHEYRMIFFNFVIFFKIKLEYKLKYDFPNIINENLQEPCHTPIYVDAHVFNLKKKDLRTLANVILITMNYK
jgi:hypothetical protein